MVGATGLELCSCFARRARETERIPAGILLCRLLNNPIPSMETHSVEQKLNGGRLVGVTGLEPAASKSQTSRATNCATPRKELCIYCTLFYGKSQEGGRKKRGEGERDFQKVVDKGNGMCYNLNSFKTNYKLLEEKQYVLFQVWQRTSRRRGLLRKLR